MNKKLLSISILVTFLLGCHRKLYNSTLQEIQHSKTATLYATQNGLNSDSPLVKMPIGYFYNTLYGLDENYVTSSESNPAILFIQRPTLIYQDRSGFPLVLHPEDSISVEYDIYAEEVFNTIDENRKSEVTGIW